MKEYLRNKVVYLAGPMHAVDDDGVGWRESITPTLVDRFNLDVKDPSKISANGVVEVADDKKRFKELIKLEQWAQLKEEFYPIVRKDLRLVDKCDFLIAVYDPTIHMFGTIHETINGAGSKKPILIKYSREHLDVFNPWLTCLVKPQWLFPTWESMWLYLDKINSGIIETSHWGLE